MRIAIASGKGGTGKTTVAVNLAFALDRDLWLLDCDVEEPNAGLFLNPTWVASESLQRMVPSVDIDTCTACGRCATACEFNAIAVLGTAPLLYPDLCRSCGACILACPEKALRKGSAPLGELQVGHKGRIRFAQARLNIGEPVAVPAIRRVKSVPGKAAEWVILDCPPGTACPMVTAVRGCDFVMLVTEPTPFGLHDLMLAAEVIEALDIPFGVIVNRAGKSPLITNACRDNGWLLLGELPWSREAAACGARNGLLFQEQLEFRKMFHEIGHQLMEVMHA